MQVSVSQVGTGKVGLFEIETLEVGAREIAFATIFAASGEKLGRRIGCRPHGRGCRQKSEREGPYHSPERDSLAHLIHFRRERQRCFGYHSSRDRQSACCGGQRYA